MRFDIFTLFPAMFEGPFSDSIIARALSAGIIQVQTHNVRDFAEGKHQVTDDYPYGGGGGMVMKPDPIFRAVEAALEMSARQAGADQGDTAQATEEEPLFISTPAPCPIILLSPQGRPFDQRVAAELAGHERLALICGRYEGVDERVRLHLASRATGGGQTQAASWRRWSSWMRSRACCQARSASKLRRRRIRTPRACWNIRTSPGRRRFGATMCRKSCFRVIMAAWRSGVATKVCAARWPAALICWRGRFWARRTWSFCAR